MTIRKICISLFSVCILFAFPCGCAEKKVDSEKDAFIQENINFATKQIGLMLEKVGEPTGKNYPRTMDDNGNLVVTGMYDWTPGFFPGSLWYLYELTGDTVWKEKAEKWTQSLEPLKTFKGHHDLGFMMYCSYGNAERLAAKPEYKDILVESAYSLASRFSEKTNVIKSWNYRLAWDGETEWFYPVIIDNMMNLEMLLYGAKVSGDKRLYDIAVTHAGTTLKNQFRDDFSSYHVVDYDTITGAVKSQATCQGFSDNSTWSRGQAWAIYGYTMMYRETKDPTFLNAAIHFADYYLERLPEDFVPLWDFNIGQDGYVPDKDSYAAEYQEKLRDVSAAAIVSSALFELAGYAKKKDYTDKAVKMLQSLASDKYRAKLNENADFILMHSVGSIPHKTEIDKPLVYADYYFLEALVRYKNMK
ncbi:glycoside hydrolase family 88 protein [Bacteroides congonensis]